MSEQTCILVTDDNPSMTKTLVDILGAKGYEVLAAYSGQEALELLGKNPVDILLTDVRMPDMNGVELYRKTRKIQPGLVAFLMTAYAADDIIREGLDEGIKIVLSKPLDINFLLTLISATSSMKTNPLP